MNKQMAVKKEYLSFFFPVAFQLLINCTAQIIDSFMLGNLGEPYISSIAFSNRIYNVYSILIFGIASGGSILIAQFWGKDDEEEGVKKSILCSMGIALFSAFVFLLAGMIFPDRLIGLFTNVEAIRVGAVGYLRIMVISYPAIAFSIILAAYFRTIGRVRIPLLISGISLIMKVLLNQMVNEMVQDAQMKMYGVAYVTIVTKLIECGILILIMKGRKFHISKRDLCKSIEFIGIYCKYVFPVVALDFCWGVGTTLYSSAYGRMTEDNIAAINIVQTIEQLLTVFIQAGGTVTGILLGYRLGAGELQRANEESKRMIGYQLVIAVLLSIGCLTSLLWIPWIFNIEEDVYGLACMSMIVLAVYMPFKCTRYVITMGILRCGADSKYAFIIEIGGVWLIGLPCAFIAALILHEQVPVVYAFVMMEEIIVMILGLLRLKRKKWLVQIV